RSAGPSCSSPASGRTIWSAGTAPPKHRRYDLMLEQLTRPRRDAGAYTYRYEMHCHCNWCSACAHSSPQAMAQAYYQAGYAGMVLTDHFLSGNSAIDRSLPWKDKAEAYWRAYEA